MEPEAPVEVSTLEEIVGNTIARPRAISMLVAVFALIALALAAVGVYGVMAYSVRRAHAGDRHPHGARRDGDVGVSVWCSARRCGWLSSASRPEWSRQAMLTRLLERLLYDVAPLDPWTFAVTTLVLLVVATVASYVPARRGMRMAPVDALRTQLTRRIGRPSGLPCRATSAGRPERLRYGLKPRTHRRRLFNSSSACFN